MRYARWSLVTLILAVSAACSRQQNRPAELTQPQSAAHVRDPHSTTADLAVPLCPATFNDSLATDGIVGKDKEGVTLPKPKYTPEAEFSDEARRQKHKGRVLEFTAVVGLVVDANGKPQNVCLMKSAGYGMDAEIFKAVQQYQFEPATKDGKPVAYRISVEMKPMLF
jgi:TonB family protein